MPTPTPELGLQQCLDSDDTADYLDSSLAQSLVTLDSLFNNATGHTHGGVHQGGPINAIPAAAIPDGSITSAKIVDGTISTVDLADGSVTASKLATGAVTTAAIAAGVTLSSPTLNSATSNSPTLNNATINNLTIQGTITSGAIWQQGPTTTDWFRVTTAGQGIFNAAVNIGIGFDSGGPNVYGGPGGGHLITESAAQTLSNKTINSPTINNATSNSPTINNSNMVNTTLSGAVAGTPTWSSAQSFPSGTRVGGALVVVNNATGSSLFKFDSGAGFANSVPNNNTTQVSFNFNAAFSTTPNVVATMRDSSGGAPSVATMHLQIRSINTNGFFAMIYNASGATQNIYIDWMAFGS